MPINKNQLFRLQILNTCLRRNKGYTAQELTDIVNDKLKAKDIPKVSSRTIYTDIKLIEDNYSIEILKVGSKYKYANSKDSINDQKVNQEERKVLEDGIEIVKALNNIPLLDKFNDVVQRLLTGEVYEKLHDPNSARIIQVGEHFNESGYEYVAKVYKAIKEKMAIKIYYQKSSNEANWRVVSPYILKEFRNQWYMVGYSKDSSRGPSSSVYALSKISSLQFLEKESYVVDKNFIAEDYFTYSLGVFHSLYKPPLEVKLKFKGDFWVDHWKQQKIHSTMQLVQLVDDEITIGFKVYHTLELESLILSFGSKVEVIEPADLRSKIKEQVAGTWDLYRTTN